MPQSVQLERAIVASRDHFGLAAPSASVVRRQLLSFLRSPGKTTDGRSRSVGRIEGYSFPPTATPSPPRRYLWSSQKPRSLFNNQFRDSVGESEAWMDGGGRTRRRCHFASPSRLYTLDFGLAESLGSGMRACDPLGRRIICILKRDFGSRPSCIIPLRC